MSRNLPKDVTYEQCDGYCQAQPQLQVKLRLKAELALVSDNLHIYVNRGQATGTHIMQSRE